MGYKVKGVVIMARDIKDLILLLNQLQGLECLVGPNEFNRRYPEFVIAAGKAKGIIRSELKAKKR